MKLEETLKWGAILGGVYVAYRVFKGVESVGKSTVDWYNQTAEIFDFTPDYNNSTWVSWFDPTERPVAFYWLTFPDGVHHFIWSSTVQADGSFYYDDIAYRIGIDKAGGLRAYLNQQSR
jgi:hypothetical protein